MIKFRINLDGPDPIIEIDRDPVAEFIEKYGDHPVVVKSAAEVAMSRSFWGSVMTAPTTIWEPTWTCPFGDFEAFNDDERNEHWNGDCVRKDSPREFRLVI